MRCISFVVAAVVILAYGLSHLDAVESVGPVVAGVDKTERIIPVLALKAGESKELLLSTWCSLNATRGVGLTLREMKNDHADNMKDEKAWQRDGISVTVPDFKEGSKTADLPEYE